MKIMLGRGPFFGGASYCRLAFFAVLWMTALSAWTNSAWAEEAQWIWSSEHQQGKVPVQASCYFRRTIQLARPDQAQISLVANDAFELYVNGRRLGAATSDGRLKSYNIGRHVYRGRNTIAVRVINSSGGDAGLAARLLVREAGQDWKSYSTDASWKVTTRPMPLWNSTAYNDRSWSGAQTLGALGDDASKLTAAGDGQSTAPTGMHAQGRFLIDDEFRVQRLMSHEQTGSLIAMAFNEFGHIIASPGDGPLLLIYDSNRDGRHDQVRTYCDQVTGCQGILPLNGDVFVTGHGPEGQGLYRLQDRDRDGSLEVVKAILRFEGPLSEHGAHGLVLGPDGFLYVVLGNHTRPVKPYGENSPYHHPIEGDLLQPRYEDPGGHAVDRKRARRSRDSHRHGGPRRGTRRRRAPQRL